MVTFKYLGLLPAEAVDKTRRFIPEQKANSNSGGPTLFIYPTRLTKFGNRYNTRRVEIMEYHSCYP